MEQTGTEAFSPFPGEGKLFIHFGDDKCSLMLQRRAESISQALKEGACSGLFLAKPNSKLLQKWSWRTASEINVSGEHKRSRAQGQALLVHSPWQSEVSSRPGVLQQQPQLCARSTGVFAFLPLAVAVALLRLPQAALRVWCTATSTSS